MMRAEIVADEVIVTTASNFYAMYAFDDIYVELVLDQINCEHSPYFERFLEGVLASFGGEFTTADFIAKLSHEAGNELLTGKRNPVLYGENIVALPSLCQCCFERLPVGAVGATCPACASVLES